MHAPGHPDPPAPRLMGTLAAHASSAPDTLVLTSGSTPDLDRLEAWLAGWKGRPARVLVLGSLGTHPDAHARRLRLLWRIEELARGSGLPVLVLRLAPMLGAASPLWLRLRSAPRLPHGGDTLLHPVAEDDVVETLTRAVEGRAAWEGWFEVAGLEALTLGELVELARRAGPRRARGSGAWEPPLAEMEEHRLVDPTPWMEHFGLAVRPVSERAEDWA